MTQDPSTALTHFLRLARRGRHPGCSSGEKRAAKLAECAIENAAGLDDDAIEGFVLFLMSAASSPQMARDALKPGLIDKVAS